MRVPVPRAVPYGWVVVALCLVVIIPFALFRWGLGVLFPFIQEDLGTTRAELGLIASGMALGMGSTALLIGWLVDTMGARRPLTASLVVAAAAVFLFSRIGSPVHGVLLGIPLGVALTTLGPGYIKAVMDWVTPKTRALAIGIAEASIPIAGIVGAVLISILAVKFGWRSTVVILGVAIAVSSVVFFAFYRDKPRGDTEGQTRSRPGTKMRLVARNPDMWVISLSGLVTSGIQICVLSYLVLFLKEYFQMSTVVAGGGLAVALAGGAVGRVGWGLVSDLLLRGRRVATMAIVSILTGVSVATMTWLPSDAPLVVVWVLLFVVGSVSLGYSGVRTVFVAELAGPDLTGTAFGFGGTISQLGNFTLAPLFGLIVDRTGSYDMAWWMIAGVALLGTLLLGFLSPQARRR